MPVEQNQTVIVSNGNTHEVQMADVETALVDIKQPVIPQGAVLGPGDSRPQCKNSKSLKEMESTCKDPEIRCVSTQNEEIFGPDNNNVDRKDTGYGEDLLYSVHDVPPWYLCILLGLQHYMTAFGSTLTVPLILAGPLCLGNDLVGLSELIATIFFVSGIATLLQTTFGIRIPIVQGATFAFLTPTLAILKQPEWLCPESKNQSIGLSNDGLNGSDGTDEVIWHSRMREIQGAICVASIAQVLIGATGLLSILVRYIGPLTITPTITLIGLSLFPVAADKAATNWGISFLTLALIAMFSQYLSSFTIPFPSLGKESRVTRLPIFKLFPILLAMLTAWFLCFILTVSGVLPDKSSSWGYLARTDIRIDVIDKSPWIRVPYPGQWGLPTVSAGAVFGMLAGVLAAMIESVGDYYACARLAGAPPPTPRAVNRGIMTEGIACIIAGLIGSGNGTTSYSENIGAIGITRVGSLRVIQVTGILLLVMGSVGKIGAVFIAIPDPVVGGMFLTMFGIVAAVGLSNLQFVDLNSSRNLFVLSASIFLGLAIPDWVNRNPKAINIGVEALDQIIKVLLHTGMFVGGAIGFLLDTTIPGTLKERGMDKWRGLTDPKTNERSKMSNTYDLPFVSGYLRQFRCIRYLPFCVDPK